MITPDLFLPGFGTGSKEETEYKPRASKYSGLAEIEVSVFDVPVSVSLGERGLVEQVGAHFARLRSDKAYSREFTDWVNAQQLAFYQHEVARAEERATQQGQPYEKRPPVVYASELRECARAIYYRMIEAPNQNPFDLNPHWAVSGLVGTTIHRLLELTFQFLGLSSESEYSVRGGSWAGRVDHILAPTQTGLVKSILDVKQVSEGEFKKGLRTSKLAGFIAQIALYARALNIDHGTVLLVCRNTGKMLELGFDISPELSLAAENRAATIQLAAIARQVPPAEERVNHGGETHVCRLICAYRATCLKEPLE